MEGTIQRNKMFALKHHTTLRRFKKCQESCYRSNLLPDGHCFLQINDSRNIKSPVKVCHWNWEEIFLPYKRSIAQAQISWYNKNAHEQEASSSSAWTWVLHSRCSWQLGDPPSQWHLEWRENNAGNQNQLLPEITARRRPKVPLHAMIQPLST